MKSGCGMDYAEAIKDAEFHEVNGVKIPFASPRTLWRIQQTHREKDIPDRLFLRQLLAERGIAVEDQRGAAVGGIARLVAACVWQQRLNRVRR